MPKLIKADPYEFYRPLLNKWYNIRFGKHAPEDSYFLKEVTKQPTTGFKLAPEKRMDDKGKMRSPELMKMVFEDSGGNIAFNLVLVTEDIKNPAILLDGFQMTIGNTVIEFREAQ